MKRQYYIFTPGKLRRKENTIFFVPFKSIEVDDDENLQNEILLSIDSDMKDTEPTEKLVLPIADIDSFNIMTESSFNTKFLEFCSKHNIPIHFFNRYGYYTGSFYPKEYLLSGSLLVKQVKYYSNSTKRMVIAKKLIEGAAFNLNKNLKYYNNRDRDLQAQIDTIESLSYEINECTDIQQLMGVEGNIRKVYYTAFEEILGKEFELISRKFYPPSNPLNALLSFANMLVYTTVLSELYRTQLNPTISYLHEPGERRFSLALDLAEIFKPLFADRLIFKLINNKQIQIKDFESQLNGYYLKESARKLFVQEYDNKLRTTIKHRKLNRDVSYRRIVRLECYKLIKHLIDDNDYEPFKIWW
ncbi:MAG: type I-B CRISPR-associated endonuclease Cas1 [Candidatus Kapabacteria bacterium]|nr:type I-B CRISPR-associated endonuclease Cas1 [Candidatus Kapabacteria bacterium]